MATFTDDHGVKHTYRVRLISEKVVRAWRDSTQPDAENSSQSLVFEGRHLYTKPTWTRILIGIKRVLKDRDDFILNADYVGDHQWMIRREMARALDPTRRSAGLFRSYRSGDDHPATYLVRGDTYGDEPVDVEELSHHILSFSALHAAGIDDPQEIEILDESGEREWFTEVKRPDGTMHKIRHHIMPSILFTYHGRPLLSGMDATMRWSNASNFIAELPVRCSTVTEAYQELKPPLVKVAEVENELRIGRGEEPVAIVRQGEWFFVEARDALQKHLDGVFKTANNKRLRSKETVRGYYKDRDGTRFGEHEERPARVAVTDGPIEWMLIKDGALPDRQTPARKDSAHTASWLLRDQHTAFARGLVKHSRNEHSIVRLATWHHVAENAAVCSWSPARTITGGRGRVD